MLNLHIGLEDLETSISDGNGSDSRIRPARNLFFLEYCQYITLLSSLMSINKHTDIALFALSIFQPRQWQLRHIGERSGKQGLPSFFECTNNCPWRPRSVNGFPYNRGTVSFVGTQGSAGCRDHGKTRGLA